MKDKFWLIFRRHSETLMTQSGARGGVICSQIKGINGVQDGRLLSGTSFVTFVYANPYQIFGEPSLVVVTSTS